MAARRKRKYRDFVIDDSDDGLEVNNISPTSRVSRRASGMSMFDADNIVIELSGTVDGRNFHRVSILKEVRRINRSKTRKINRYKRSIEGR
jgi:hypothetical protein